MTLPLPQEPSPATGASAGLPRGGDLPADASRYTVIEAARRLGTTRHLLLKRISRMKRKPPRDPLGAYIIDDQLIEIWRGYDERRKQ